MYLFSNNIGDNLNYFLLNDMINEKVSFYNRYFRQLNNTFWDFYILKKMKQIEKIDLFFIGSILDTICNWSYIFHKPFNTYKNIISEMLYKTKPLLIFGTGFISPQNYQNESYIRNIKVIAVRGNITLQRLKKNGINIDNDVILADPGILAPLLINITDIYDLNLTKKYNLCVIPHYIDKDNKAIKKNIKVENSIFLNIETNPHKFIESLLKCKSVLSSGLHGLIISDSLGIPNMRMIASDNILGGDYKFKDYYSSFGLDSPPKIDLRKTIFTENNLTKLKSDYYIKRDLIRNKQCQLLTKFPYKLTEKYKHFRNIICSNVEN